MRPLPAILIVSALFSTADKAHAFSCDEFRATILAITAEDKAIDAKHKALGTSDAEQCRFNKDVFIINKRKKRSIDHIVSFLPDIFT